jgi:hypothetical protein
MALPGVADADEVVLGGLSDLGQSELGKLEPGDLAKCRCEGDFDRSRGGEAAAEGNVSHHGGVEARHR